MTEILGPKFFQRDTTEVARRLLGCTLVHRVGRSILSGRIVETEAYLGIEDRACHSFGGRRTERLTSMYLEGGHAYVYLIYGGLYILRGSNIAEQKIVSAPRIGVDYSGEAANWKLRFYIQHNPFVSKT